MSGQWDSGEKPTEGTSCFPRIRVAPTGSQILQEILGQDQLIEKVYRLTADEVKIVSIYVDSLLKTRPLREGWETTVNGPGWVDREERAHMAMLELENDPK